MMRTESVSTMEVTRPPVQVSAEDAELIRKVRRILRTGKNVEIKQDASGNAKVYKISKEIER